LPDGSYSISGLNSSINQLIDADGNVTSLVDLLPDYSTQKAYWEFGTNTGWFIHYDSDSPFTLLGGADGDNFPASKSNTSGEIVYNTNAAAFNNVESVNISTNLCGGVLYGTRRSDILYSIVPTASIGSTQRSAPENLAWVNSDLLRAGISEIVITTTDQNGTLLPFTENWLLLLQLRSI